MSFTRLAYEHAGKPLCQEAVHDDIEVESRSDGHLQRVAWASLIHARLSSAMTS